MSKKNFIPKYAYIPLISAVLFNIVVYNCSKIITNNFFHHDFSNIIDTYIPFLKIFIIIYILAYLHWIIGFIIISKENSKTCYNVMSAEIIAKLICLFFFFVIPTTLTRPEILGNDILAFLTNFIYKMDDPVNLFPSIHCLESWMVFRATMKLENVPNWYKWVIFIGAILICASTVFVKQHVFIDIIGGIIVGELGFFIARKCKTGLIFEKINAKLKK